VIGAHGRGEFAPVRSGVDGWPLVGRREALSQLTAAVVAQRGAVLTGPAGAGKTTLALMCLELAQERGMSLARATATRAAQGLPFGAFASMLPPDPEGEGLSRLDRVALLGRYARAMVEGAGGRPLVVFVDDAHLLDEGSATLVHQLALTRSATVLATVRSGEAVPDPVVALWKDGPAERIEVGVLDNAAIEELLVTVLGGPVDAASVRRLADHCQGNPMVLRELVSGALETGALVEEVVGIWRLRGDLQPTARLMELVALRLGELPGPERGVLELLTVSEPLEQAELTQLTEPAAVDALERKGLITSRMDGRRIQVWFAHPVYGDVTRVGVSALRERVIARSLAEVIEATGARRRADTLWVASWRLVAGGGSADLLLAGAIAARARHDHSLTERLARAAIDEGAGFAARFVAAEAAHFEGRPDQAEQELATLAADATSDAEGARVALLRFDNTYLLQGRADLQLLDDALEAVADPFWRDELVARRLFVMSSNSGPRATVEAGSTVLQRPGTGPLTAAHVLLLYSLVRLGRLDDAIQLSTRPSGSGEIPATDESWDQWGMFVIRTVARVYAGRLGEAEELFTAAYGQVVDQPAAEARAFVTGWSAGLYLEQGRVQSAFRRAGESYTLFQQLGRTYVARWPYIAAVQALALAGRADRALETLAAFDALGLPTMLPGETDLLQARAWTAAAAADLPAARAQLEAAADLGEEIGDLIGAASALHGLARLGRARDVATRLADLATQVDGDLVTTRAAHANALATRNSEHLDKVASDFEDLGAILYAAEARAEAAVVLRRGGDTRKAAAAEQHAARLLARCEGAATPPVRMITARVRITSGELDIALQAAAGRTNKQIAAELHLSVRTVESHLQRVYEKLGVSGRHELTDALRDRPSA
jgi:DNA-binding NarL/FixJ family response regulator